MNTESLLPLLLLITPFAIIFFIKAMVLYFFKIRRFWSAIGISVIINLITLAIIFYGVMSLLGNLNYEFNGLHLPAPVVFFLWWFSSVTEGFLLHLFFRQKQKRQLFAASIVMNALSYIFLYIFIINSH